MVLHFISDIGDEFDDDEPDPELLAISQPEKVEGESQVRR